MVEHLPSMHETLGLISSSPYHISISKNTEKDEKLFEPERLLDAFKYLTTMCKNAFYSKTTGSHAGLGKPAICLLCSLIYRQTQKGPGTPTNPPAPSGAAPAHAHPEACSVGA